MDYSKHQFKKSTFLSDNEIHKFHHSCVALLRWKLKPEQKGTVLAELEWAIEFIHSQYLAYGVTTSDVYEVLLGDRLSLDPDYLTRLLRHQGSSDLVKLQSVMSNVKLKAIYPKFVMDLVDQFANPDNDKRLIDVWYFISKWSE